MASIFEINFFDRDINNSNSINISTWLLYYEYSRVTNGLKEGCVDGHITKIILFQFAHESVNLVKRNFIIENDSIRGLKEKVVTINILLKCPSRGNEYLGNVR